MPVIYNAKKDKSKDKEQPQAQEQKSSREQAVELAKQETNNHVLEKIHGEIREILKDKPKNGFLTAFVGKPSGIKFETQDRDEKIIALLRRHWVVNVPWVIMSFILIILIPYIGKFPVFSILPSDYPLIITLAYFVFILYFIIGRLLSWFYNVYIITDERIVDVDFYSMLYKNISGTKIDKIQDVSYDVIGLVEAFFNFGTVRIQTAGETPNFDFENVPKPQQVVSLLNQLLMEEEVEKIEGRVR